MDKVKQTTIRDWLRGTLSARIRLEQKDSLLEKLLSTKKSLEIETAAAKLKVSLHMARILERYVQDMRVSFMKNATSIVKGQEVIISEAKVRKLIHETGNEPINAQRKQALSKIERELQRGSLTKLDDRLRADIKAQFDKFWPELDFRDRYLHLLSDTNELLKLSKGDITREVAEYFAKLSSGRQKPFATHDLPALCYLDRLLNTTRGTGKGQRTALTFEHVVIDEAQDVSPLEFLLLYLQSSNKSFTILGDIEQRLFPHRGITSWREVKSVFSNENPQRWDARVSYRATYELTRYANRVLRVIAPKTIRAVPYKRHGEKPILLRSKSYGDMVNAIADDIRSLKTKGMQTIAVLCKTSNEASKLQKGLLKAGIEDAVLPNNPSYERTKTTVSSIYMMKGVEFDAVILSNARRNNYTGSNLHNRLLYIAVTRAAHVLHVHWVGAIAGALADPTLLPKTKRKRHKPAYKKKHKRVR